jgi:hypothetical protein
VVAVGLGVGLVVMVTVGVGVGLVVMVTVGVGVGLVVMVTVGVGVGFMVMVTVGVGVGVVIAVGVEVGDALTGAVAMVGDTLGFGFDVGANVTGAVTCPESPPVNWGVQAVTVMPPAANKPTIHAVASGRASRRLDWPVCLAGWIRVGLEADASAADVTVLVVLPKSAHSTSVEVTGPLN